MIEILEKHEPLGRPDLILFDFDGTISKLRTGWDEVMKGLFIDCIPGKPCEVSALSERYIDESTGIPTIRQMKWLAQQVKERGKKALEPWEYKEIYARRLMESVSIRKQEVINGTRPAEYYLVPGSKALLKAFKDRGIPLIVASGTDEADVRCEAETLGVAAFFDEIAGADVKADMCAKEETMRRIIRPGLRMLVVGDGRIEIQLGREADALTLGVASRDKYGIKPGIADSAKRNRLMRAGAHAIVPDFENSAEILDWIYN